MSSCKKFRLKNHLLLFLALSYSFYIFPQNNFKKVTDSVNVLIKLSDKQNLASNFQEALKFATLAVNHASTTDDKVLQGRAYICLANTYEMIDDNASSEKYFRAALLEGKNSNNYFLTVGALNGLGNVYASDSTTVDKAAAFYEESVKYALKEKKIEHIYITYSNISGMYLDFKQPDRAHPFLGKANYYLDQLEKPSPLYITLLQLYFAKYHQQKAQPDKAIVFINEAQTIAEKHTLNLDLIDIYKLKSTIHEDLGEFDLAIHSLKKMQEFKDLNFNSEKSQQIEEIKAKFEVNEYEHAAKMSKSKTNTIIITSIGLLLLISSLFLMFYLNKKRKALAILEEKNTALIAAKNEAERVNKLKSDLLVNISHELRTPLYGVIGITSMLMDETNASQKQKELLNSLKFSGVYLKNLINNILRIEDIESKNITLTNKPTNLYRLVSSMVDAFKTHADENQNTLTLTLPKSVDRIYSVDGFKLSEILINLISNANKFTSGGKIEVKLDLLQHNANDTDAIRFTIRDTGIGIPKENLKTIFENFKQGVEENTSYGAGLGLSISKHLIEILGGEIEIKSVVNKGSEFSFVLDLSTNIEDYDAHSIENQVLKILVAEDNKINQMVTKRLILSIGHECSIVKNGLEAVNRCKEEAFDLILMDINMPVMNGLEATKAIKAFKPDCKIIALTALEISEIATQCREAGLDDVINKPINKEQLSAIISTNLSRVAKSLN